MKYKVDGWNNFCRVFRLPDSYPEEYCFGGGYPVNFQMIDWFNPVSGLPSPAVDKETWIKEVGQIDIIEISLEELQTNLIPFINNKKYIHSGKRYLVLYDFGGSSTFTGEKHEN